MDAVSWTPCLVAILSDLSQERCLYIYIGKIYIYIYIYSICFRPDVPRLKCLNSLTSDASPAKVVNIDV